MINRFCTQTGLVFRNVNRTGVSLLVILLGGLVCCSQSFAAQYTYNGFSSTSNLTLNGNAAAINTSDGAVIRLVRAQTSENGNFFSSAAIQAGTFSAFFTFRITNPGGLSDGYASGGDGLVFVVQSVSNSIGSNGSGIGYGGITNSIGACFDTWMNTGYYDPSSNYLGIDVNGNVNHGYGSPSTKNVSTNFDDGNIWYAWVDYDGTNLEVRANETGVRPAAADLSRPLDIISYLGQSNAFVGVTASTGAAYENIDILSLTYRDSYNPVVCTYRLTTASTNVIATSGSGNIGITAGNGCSWSASSDATNWLHTTSSEAGNGTVSYSYDANSSVSSRTGHITVGGQTFTVTQAAAAAVATPKIAPAGGTFTNSAILVLSCATPGATIRYTTDGSVPIVSSPVYRKPFAVTSTSTIKAAAFKIAMTSSGTASATFTIINPQLTVAPPVITPAGGTFTNSVKVTLSCATAGATIRYAEGSTVPATISFLYKNTAIILTNSGTLKAQAGMIIKNQLVGSSLATAVFTIIPLPVITTASLPAGKLKTNYSLTLTTTGGATPYKWSLASGTLPAGLKLNATTGAITGTPTKTGAFNFTVEVTDANKKFSTKEFTLTVNN